MRSCRHSVTFREWSRRSRPPSWRCPNRNSIPVQQQPLRPSGNSFRPSVELLPGPSWFRWVEGTRTGPCGSGLPSPEPSGETSSWWIAALKAYSPASILTCAAKTPCGRAKTRSSTRRSRGDRERDRGRKSVGGECGRLVPDGGRIKRPARRPQPIQGCSARRSCVDQEPRHRRAHPRDEPGIAGKTRRAGDRGGLSAWACRELTQIRRRQLGYSPSQQERST